METKEIAITIVIIGLGLLMIINKTKTKHFLNDKTQQEIEEYVKKGNIKGFGMWDWKVRIILFIIILIVSLVVFIFRRSL